MNAKLLLGISVPLLPSYSRNADACVWPCQGQISCVFFASKKKLQSALFDIEEVADAMRRILASTDPIEAFRIYEDEIAQHVDGSGRLDLGTTAC